jgi:hypothetical protein
VIKLPQILPQPERPSHLSLDVKWLSGEGAGSWFLVEISVKPAQFKITRFSPDGKEECKGYFRANKEMNLKDEFCLSYPSHCATVTVMQNKEKIVFKII